MLGTSLATEAEKECSTRVGRVYLFPLYEEEKGARVTLFESNYNLSKKSVSFLFILSAQHR